MNKEDDKVMSTTAEKTLLFLQGSNNIGCDLWFTDKRLAMIFDGQKSYLGFTIGFLAGGIIGAVIGDKIATDLKSKQYAKNNQTILLPISINELLQQNKNNRAVNYEDLEYIRLHQSRFGGNLTFKSEVTGWRQLTPNKDQMKQLFLVLPTIVALNGKLEIK